MSEPDIQVEALIAAWRLTPGSADSFGSPARESEFPRITANGRPLPDSAVALYRRHNGVDVLGGNLRVLPLAGSDEFCVAKMSAAYRGWKWHIPDELLLIANNGGDEAFGLWLPPGDRSDDAPVVEVGELFEPGCMAVAGTGLLPFLRGWTAYFTLLQGGPEEALDLLGVPAGLRQSDPDLSPLRRWADPRLPNFGADPYTERLDAEAVRQTLARPRPFHPAAP